VNAQSIDFDSLSLVVEPFQERQCFVGGAALDLGVTVLRHARWINPCRSSPASVVAIDCRRT
jgi:hypothetical protein